MSVPVHILATCRKPELLDYTTLVFRTLRLGFPEARVTIHNNQLPHCALDPVTKLALQNVCALAEPNPTIHHEWIERLLQSEDEPFFLLDSDVVLFENFERFLPQFQDAPLAGYRIPEWRDEFSGCITRARLHTSLLYVNPPALARSLKHYDAQIADTPFTPKANLIYPLVLPFKQQPYFYDTAALLYHAVGGFAFTDEMKDAYFHAHFGTISDVVLPRLPADTAAAMDQARSKILENPALGHGQWRMQDAYWSNRQV